jgi:hypothetical protein
MEWLEEIEAFFLVKMEGKLKEKTKEVLKRNLVSPLFKKSLLELF